MTSWLFVTAITIEARHVPLPRMERVKFKNFFSDIIVGCERRRREPLLDTDNLN